MSKKAKVSFSKLIQDSQEFGSNDEYMVSRVFFTIEIDGKVVGNYYSDLKQTVGSSHEEEGSIEVGKPIGYQGPFNYEAFSKGAVRYFRSLIGSGGSGIKIVGNCSNIRMMNNTFIQTFQIEFDVEKSGAGW